MDYLKFGGESKLQTTDLEVEYHWLPQHRLYKQKSLATVPEKDSIWTKPKLPLVGSAGICLGC